MDEPLQGCGAHVVVWADVGEWMGSHPRCAWKSRWLHVQSATVIRVVAMGSGEQPIDDEGVRGDCVRQRAPRVSLDGEMGVRKSVGAVWLSPPTIARSLWLAASCMRVLASGCPSRM